MTLLMTCETNNKKKNKYTKIKNIKIVKTTKKKRKKKPNHLTENLNFFKQKIKKKQ